MVSAGNEERCGERQAIEPLVAVGGFGDRSGKNAFAIGSAWHARSGEFSHWACAHINAPANIIPILFF